VQRRKIARTCAPSKLTQEHARSWKAIADSLQGPCYLSSDEDDRKIRAKEQGRDIGKYFLEIGPSTFGTSYPQIRYRISPA
jgi:hypothetical protein